MLTLVILGGMDTFSGEITLSKLCCLSSEKGFSLKGRICSPAPHGATLVFETKPLSKRGLVYRKANRKSQKLSFMPTNDIDKKIQGCGHKCKMTAGVLSWIPVSNVECTTSRDPGQKPSRNAYII